uniref:TM2 domain-containing protein n=1 Tax=Chromera velia CCMP2878 TaxID=1169474 RepID=A0A0G4I8Q8_9ALVE|eukprot:Cvel_12035.t1-p1 / transcript=Cvel_12035.t1 / gene=Cvel_12035 / organism=Chromera_velia_CCMP2878 / gene_product=hypothetical protein / transcript_product=hypothetical protein / location=Cvel_scaffold773:23115-25337(-) / protein_length=741 / sequence_SO=supercontig / SO=protein_coding / is_pseudo=false
MWSTMKSLRGLLPALCVFLLPLSWHAEASSASSSTKFGKELYSTNMLCAPNRCLNPIFPALTGLQTMKGISSYTCVDNADGGKSLPFCGEIVTYNYQIAAIPDGVTTTQTPAEYWEGQALTDFVWHMGAMGFDEWDYRTKVNENVYADPCALAVLKLACYTYFPKCEHGHWGGETGSYVQPCFTACSNYITACQVECCDESVQCVFEFTQKDSDGNSLTQTGYSSHFGPSAFCTGSPASRGARTSFVLLGALAFLHFFLGASFFGERAGADGGHRRGGRGGGISVRFLPFFLFAVVTGFLISSVSSVSVGVGGRTGNQDGSVKPREFKNSIAPPVPSSVSPPVPAVSLLSQKTKTGAVAASHTEQQQKKKKTLERDPPLPSLTDKPAQAPPAPPVPLSVSLPSQKETGKNKEDLTPPSASVQKTEKSSSASVDPPRDESPSHEDIHALISSGDLAEGSAQLGVEAASAAAVGMEAVAQSDGTLSGTHTTGYWRIQRSYEDSFMTITTGGVSVKNSCSDTSLALAEQCSGRGLCTPWFESQAGVVNAPHFCKCSRDWAGPECQTQRKSQVTAYCLSLFVGFLGADQWYLGLYSQASLKTATLGGLGVWWLYDIVRVGSQPVYAYNYRVAADLPRWAFIVSSVCWFAALGFIVVGLNTLRTIRRKRKDALLLAAEKAAHSAAAYPAYSATNPEPQAAGMGESRRASVEKAGLDRSGSSLVKGGEGRPSVSLQSGGGAGGGYVG